MLSIEKTSSERIRGLSVDIMGSCELNGRIWKKNKRTKMIFWEDDVDIDTKQTPLTIFTTSDFVGIQNIWAWTSPLGTRTVDSSHNGAAMIIEEIENGRRYRCNDGYPDEDFDDIVFTVKKISKKRSQQAIIASTCNKASTESSGDYFRNYSCRECSHLASSA
jgi:hypothetical protein